MSRVPRGLWAICIFTLSLCFTGQVVLAEGAFTGVVTGDQVNVRSGPHTNYYRVLRLPKGAIVDVIESTKSGDVTWLHITPPEGAASNIHADYVELSEDGKTGIVKGRRVRVRAPSPAGPDVAKSYKVQAYMNDGDRVRVIAQNGDWLQIAPPEGVVLFVSSQFVARATPEDIAAFTQVADPPVPPAPPATTVAVEASPSAPVVVEVVAEVEPVVEVEPVPTPVVTEVATPEPVEPTEIAVVIPEPTPVTVIEPEPVIAPPNPPAPSAPPTPVVETVEAAPTAPQPAALQPVEPVAVAVAEPEPATPDVTQVTIKPTTIAAQPRETDDALVALPRPAPEPVTPEPVREPVATSADTPPTSATPAEPDTFENTETEIVTRVIVEKGGTIIIREPIAPANPTPTPVVKTVEPRPAVVESTEPIVTEPDVVTTSDPVEVAIATPAVEPVAKAEPTESKDDAEPAQPKDPEIEAALANAKAKLASNESRLAELETELSTTRAQLNSQRDKARQAVVESRQKRYDAVGTLMASSIYTGQRLPLLYRIVDPQTGLTTAYIRPTTTQGLTSLMGQLIGIHGKKRYDPALKLNVIAASSADILVAADRDVATFSTTTTRRQARPVVKAKSTTTDSGVSMFDTSHVAEPATVTKSTGHYLGPDVQEIKP